MGVSLYGVDWATMKVLVEGVAIDIVTGAVLKVTLVPAEAGELAGKLLFNAILRDGSELGPRFFFIFTIF